MSSIHSAFLVRNHSKYFAKVSENHFIMPPFSNRKKTKVFCNSRLTQIKWEGLDRSSDILVKEWEVLYWTYLAKRQVMGERVF